MKDMFEHKRESAIQYDIGTDVVNRHILKVSSPQNIQYFTIRPSGVHAIIFIYLLRI